MNEYMMKFIGNVPPDPHNQYVGDHWRQWHYPSLRDRLDHDGGDLFQRP